MNMKKNDPTAVFDSEGTRHELEKEVGSGGQGVVWETRRENILVKCLKGSDVEKRELNYRRLTYLMLRNDLPHREIAVPKALLAAPDCGYVMELMDEMVSLEGSLRPPRNCRDVEQIIEWYKSSGAIRRRILLLHRLSGILVEIHSKGFCFGDLSPHNVFISENPEHHEVQLIDCDNLVLLSESDSRLYTPRYGAPELVRGESVHSTMTDAFSFAVIAYELLTLSHPLIGDMVSNGEPELEEAAFKGELPWVEDAKDASNVSKDGLPSELVVFKTLRELFQKTFSDSQNFWTRPGMMEWHEALGSVLRGFLKCDHCGAFFVYNKDLSCPFCKQAKDKNHLIALKFLRWDPKAEIGERLRNPKEIQLPRMILNKGETIEIPATLQHAGQGTLEITMDYSALYLLVKETDKRRVVIRKKIGKDVDEGMASTLTPGRRQPIKREGGIRSYCVHFDELDVPHRVLSFKWGVA
jgi:serine/threonine protein kinase